MVRLVFVLLAVFVASCSPPAADSPAPADPGYVVPAFALTERSGKPVTNADLKGSVWVASFVFTRCNGPCPAVTATVARLQKELTDVPGVKFVTFTVDPARDDPAELKKYAERYGADAERWLFLTGKEPEVNALMQYGFKIGVMKKPDGKPGDEFDHSTKLAVVDGAGVIRGYFDGMAAPREGGEKDFEANLAKLKELVRRLK